MKFKKVMSLILSVLIMIGVFSTATPVLAAETNAILSEKEYQENLLSETVDSEEKKAEIVSEIPEKRGEYSKTYKRADGSFSTVYSQTPIHTFQNGEWKEIDNTLKSEGEILKNADGSFEIEFPETISENEKITVTNDGETIAFSVNNIESSSAVVSEPELNESDVIEKDLSKTVSEITYESIDENTDVQYIVSSDFVKENIIVSDKESLKAAYSFDIEKGSLNAVLDEDNNLEFRNEKNEIVFMIPAPVMKDSNDEASYDIDVAVENADKEVLTLIYTPSAEWLNSRERSYPVTIDPVISIPSDNGSFISDTTIRDGDNINKNFVNNENGFICNTGENAEVLVKFNIDGFEIFKSSNIVVTEANFVCNSISRSNSEILLKEIAQSWDVNSVTYASVYSGIGRETDFYCNEILDFCLKEESEEAGIVAFNITDLFNGWLRGEENNGFGLVPAETSETDVAVLLDAVRVQQSGTYRFNSVCVLDYVDTSGYNSSYEYLTQEIGRAGIASVNTFSRGLSLSRSDLGLSGNILPVDIAFNYDCGYNRLKDIFTDIFDSAELTASLCYGNKWVPSYIQALSVFTDTQYQAYTAEGTVLSFDLVSEVDGETTGYSFEEVEGQSSGYSLELISSGAEPSVSNIRLVSPEGYATYFNENGLAILICDAEDTLPETEEEAQSFKYIFIAYDSSMRIDYITDGVGRKYDFSYNEQGLLSEVNCLTAANEQIKAGTTETPLKVTYSYDSLGNLVRVTYPDGKNVLYNYESGNLVKVTNIDNYNISYSYDSLGKVTMITEKAGTTAGNFITLEELSNRQIKITDAYNGTETYQFGKNGQLHYTFDDKGNFCKSDYAPSKDENVYSSSEWEIASENLLKNGSFEKISNLKPDSWENAFDSENIATISGFTDYACKVSGTNQQTQTISVDGGKNYTFSLYAKNQSSVADATLDMQITAKKGIDVFSTESRVVSLTEDMEQYSVTVSTDYDINEITVAIGGNGTIGEILVDNAQLEAGNGTAAFNYIENGNFNDGNNSWSEATVVSEAINGKTVNAVKLNGGIPGFSDNAVEDSVSAITQNVKINGKKGDVYSVGGWFKGLFDDSEFSISEEQPEKSIAQIKVTYSYSDVVETTDESTNETTETQETVTENFSVDFAPNNDDWQYAVDSFALKGDAESVDVTVLAKNLTSDSFATGIELTQDDAAFSFFEEETTDTEEITEADSPTTEETLECPCESCEEFDCSCRCASETDCTCIQCKRRSDEVSTSEDGKTELTQSFDGEKYMQSSVTYSDDLNYVVSETDSNNISTSYEYNSNNGSLVGITDGSGNETVYQSNPMGYLTLAETDVSGLTDNALKMAISYAYNGDLLTTVNQGNVQYTYEYDEWCQLKNVLVDGNVLVSYNYGEGINRGRVCSVVFGDDSEEDFTVSYIYDNKTNNIIAVEKFIVIEGETDTITYSYAYDNLGNLVSISDDETGHKIAYTETGLVISDMESGQVIYEIKDAEIPEETEETGEQPVSITEETANGVLYTHNVYESSYDSLGGKTTEAEAVIGGKTIGTEAVSDWFGRNEAVTVMTKNPKDSAVNDYASITSQYGFVTNDNVTTNLISSFNNTILGEETNSVNYSYSYDSDGRITSVSALSTLSTLNASSQYIYDQAGQLIREITGSNTYEYAYDSKGNITSRKLYSGETLLSTDSFTYGADSWEDRLTGYNNKTISYDKIGNPTSYLGATLSWRGRELVKYEKGNKQISYSYDVDGMRYRKTVKENNTLTETYDYVYSDGTLILLTYTANGTSNTARFVYDSFGEPRGFILNNSAAFLYLKNAQGDITGIVDESGEVLLTYSYTAWGKVSFTATNMDSLILAGTLSKVNPFTYRGYCYDFDINLYYLQSRYYDPQICRFINADSTDYLGATGTLLSYNLFAYCENDGVNFVDESGFYSAEKAIKYAKKWTGGVNDQPDAVFHNDKFYFYESGDCINFVSQCLYYGGLKMNHTWHSYKFNSIRNGKTRVFYLVSPAWRLVSKFYKYIQKSSIWSRSIEFWTNEKATKKERRAAFLKYSDLVELGAVILMDFKFDGKTKYTHAALVVGVTLNDVKYAAHTSNRWWQSLWQMVENGKIERYIIYNIFEEAV